MERMPGEDASVLMVAPDLATEILLRSGRVDRLLLGDPWETSFVADDELPALRARVDALRPGDRMLMDAAGRSTLATLRADPARDPLTELLPDLAPLQAWALQRIDRALRPAPGRTRAGRLHGGGAAPPPLNLRDRSSPFRCSTSRKPAQSVLAP